jgi:hypothetical protein
MRRARLTLTMLACAALLTSGCANDEESDEGEDEEGASVLSAAKLLIEHNATDEDTGFQGFADGDPWNELEITGPSGRVVVVKAQGGLGGFGLTELFFETSEPPNAEVPIADVLARLPEGAYTFTGKMVDGTVSSRTANFTLAIPAGPVLVAPAEGAQDVDPNNAVVSWQSVTKTYDGSADVRIVGYQVIVEKKEEPPAFPQGFARPVFSVYLPASATSVTLPKEFMVANALYDWEVLAIEDSGNQTLSSSDFMTGSATDPPEPQHEPSLTQAKLLIEHNATDKDTGFQGFGDGDPWKQLQVNPATPLVVVSAEGGLLDFGLTELFFETSEPPNDEVSIADVLARIPEGAYAFAGNMVGASESRLTATFTHRIPAGPKLLTPTSAANDVDPHNTVISWEAVSETVDGSPDIEIVGYEVIVEKDVEPANPHGFAQSTFSVHLPASATRVTIPQEFMEAGAPYKFEVLAIEESGNQTLASAAFTTK